MSQKILMIDDAINLVNVVKMVLEAKDYQFFTAHSAADGLEKIKECNPNLNYSGCYNGRFCGWISCGQPTSYGRI